MTSHDLSSFLRGATLTVVLGVGSELRGDDAAGILIARCLVNKHPRIIALEGHTAPESFAGKIIKLKPSHVLVADAAEMGLDPGAWEIPRRAELDKTMTSTHLIPLTALAKHLEEGCGCKVAFVGIQTGRCGVAIGVSAPVLRAIDEISNKIVKLVAKNEPK